MNVYFVIVFIEVIVGEDFLLSLAGSVLKLSSPTRGNFVLLSSLSAHISAQDMLQLAPNLPQELMKAMGHQSLACKVSWLLAMIVSR